MRSGLKRVAHRAATARGVLRVARRLSAQWPRIVMYHGFCGPGELRDDCTPVEVLRAELTYIKRHYRPLRLRDLGGMLAGGETPPPRSVVITVDDGYVNFRRWALPLLQELGIPVTVFVVSDLADGEQWLWTDKFKYVWDRARQRADVPEFHSQATLTALKRLPPLERDRALAELATEARISIPARAPDSYALLAWTDLQELATAPGVDIGSHSRTHTTLAPLQSAQAWEEISGSRDALQGALGAEVASFCYPNGLPWDFSAEHVAMVAKAGYACATAAHFGCVTGASSRFALPRIGAVNAGLPMFRQQLDGFAYLRYRLAGERCW